MNKRQLRREIALLDAQLAADITRLRARRKMAGGEAAAASGGPSLPLLLGGSLAGGLALGLLSRKIKGRHFAKLLRWGISAYLD